MSDDAHQLLVAQHRQLADAVAQQQRLRLAQRPPGIDGDDAPRHVVSDQHGMSPPIPATGRAVVP
jgi:hypothetical protein